MMKKYFMYELKRNWHTLLVLTVFSCLIYFTAVLSTDFIYNDYYGNTYVYNTLIYIPIITLMVLSILLPILMFAFKMNGKQADCFYSLPIRREKLYLIKSLVGLLLVIIPYTAAYWLGFAATALKPNAFELVGFVPAYFISLPLALLLFGINAFVFTRANRTVDGIIFVGLYSCAAVFPAYVICQWATQTTYFTGVPYGLDPSFWTTYSPLTWLSTKYNAIISGKVADAMELPLYLTASVLGAAAWFGLFFTARHEKAENAEQVSDSPFGYVVMIPLYLTAALACLNIRDSVFILYYVLIAVVAVVGYIIFRRSIKLKIPDLISLAGASCLGMLLSFI